MPELPEVETIRRGLERYLPGLRIARIVVREPRLRWPVDVRRVQEQATGQVITGLSRKAKYLLLHLENEHTLILHLGMSGRLLFLQEPTSLQKHDHVRILFETGAELRFRDPRRFGMFDLARTDNLAVHPRLRELGAEPLEDGLRAEDLYGAIRRSRRAIKHVIMDARIVAGVGNIYANEALFHARIHPEKLASTITIEEWRGLFQAIQNVLQSAIRQGGTTLNDFVNSDGEMGYFQMSLAVYGREGKACPVCGARICKIAQSGRSSFFCPDCQKEQG